MTLQSNAAPPVQGAAQDSGAEGRAAVGRIALGPLAGIVVADFSRVLATPAPSRRRNRSGGRQRPPVPHPVRQSWAPPRSR